MAGDYLALLTIAAAAVLCPLIAHAIPRKIVPETVLLLLSGSLLGPNALGVIQNNGIIMFLSQLGLSFQFLLAGYEIDPAMLRGSKGRKGLLTWIFTFALALLASMALVDEAENRTAFLAIAIAMTSTAFGTVLSILKERRLDDTAIGASTLSYGVWGQLGPVAAIALLLSSRHAWQTALLLAVLVGLSVSIASGARRLKRISPRLIDVIREKSDESSQLILRISILLLIALVTLASLFGLNIMLGAFAAGFVMRHVAPGGHKRTETKLSGIGHGFLIPIFFVESGTKIDLFAIAADPALLAVCVVALVGVRALPVFVAQSLGKWHRLRRIRDRASVAAYCTTALSIIVAVTTIAVDAGALNQEIASSMVAAAAVSVLVMPLAAQMLHGLPGKDADSMQPVRLSPERERPARSQKSLN